MVKLTEKILELREKFSPGEVPDEKTKNQHQIAATDKRIDSLVYRLYNVTPEEIKIIEEANR